MFEYYFCDRCGSIGPMQLSSAKFRAAPGPTVAAAEAASEEVLRLREENERLRDRLQRLGEASLRANVCLDLDSVLQGVIDGARLLTVARYGALITFAPSGRAQNLFTSGIADEERQRLVHLPEGNGLLGHLNEIEEPLRLNDLASHPRSSGFPPGHPPMGTFLGIPILHQGERLGNIYLAEKEDGREFTAEDEEIIVGFSAQAAVAILNARDHSELLRAKNSLEALIEISPAGIMVYDAKTMDLLSLNPEVRRIVRGLRTPGRSYEEILSVIDIRHPDGGKVERDRLATERARRYGEVVRSEEAILQLPDGQAVTVLNSAAPIYSEDGEVAYVVAVIQDMTPLEDLERLRAQFLGMVSQELRGPLTTIKGATSMALNPSSTPDAAEAQQYFGIIDKSANRIRTLVNDLLDVTQIETGAFTVDLQPANLRALAEEAKETFARSGARNSVELEVSPDLPKVRADKRRMVQALGNLLSNASRSSADWSVIRMNASAQNEFISVSVSDEGWGISAERLPYFFRGLASPEHEEAHPDREDRQMAMAICKGIVEAHGGRIWADSDGPGQGARITFTIPTDGGGKGEGAAGTSSNGKVRIVLADDEPQTLLNVQGTFFEAGYETIVAGNPGEVESLVWAEKPDLVLLNSQLGGTDGAELIRRLKDLNDTPVIFLVTPEDDRRGPPALAAGAEDYIVKPLFPNELLTRVEAALRRKRKRSEKTSEPYLLGDLKIDYVERRVTVAGQTVRLTATEYELLRQLSVNAGRVLSHKQLLRLAWGEDFPDDSRLLRSFIKKLRGKLGDDAGDPVYIFTEPRVGYRMPKAGGGNERPWRSGL